MKFVLFATLIWSILDSGWSITDEDLMRIEAGLSQIQVLSRENNQLRSRMDHLEIELSESRERVDHLEEELTERVVRLEETCGAASDVNGQGLAQNLTIEERVTILEGEMTIVQTDVMEVKDQVAFLFDEQVIQDERIFILEQETTDLDTRVEVLEENGGGGGNVTALEVRVETLEGTTAEQEADIADLDSATSNLDGRVETLEGETSELETRLTAAKTQIEDLRNVTSNLDNQLTAAEAQIEGLQTTDVELDSRITDLEEIETAIAFRAVMDESDDNNVADDSTVIFSDVQLNEGNGYDPATGIFTVPSGGEGYYYFATHFTVYTGKFAYIDIRVNDVTVCTMYDSHSDGTNHGNGGCNAVVYLSEGDEVKNFCWERTDFTPVYEWTDGVYNGFTGFRI